MPIEFQVNPSFAALTQRESPYYPEPGTLGNEFAGQVAIVTGASRSNPMGIGAACAIELARQGLRAVTITSTISSEQQARETAQIIADQGTRVLWLEVDHRQIAENQRVAKTTIERFGTLNLVVGAAGKRYDGISLRLREETWDGAIDLMLKGNQYLGAAAMEQSMRSKTLELKALVYVGSIIGEFGNKGQVSYAAAKAGLDGVVRSQSQEWGSRGVRVNVVHPGFVATEMTGDLVGKPEVEEMIKARISLGRMARAEEIAHLITFLLSPRASYITGGSFRIDGGIKPFA